jgi:serine/threonine protein kinase
MLRAADDWSFLAPQDEEEPVKWMPPEALDPEIHRYVAKSDIWSFGVLMLELLKYGANPFPQQSNSSIREKLTRKIPVLPLDPSDREKLPAVPDRHRKLLSECWEMDPDRRPSAAGLFDKIRKEFATNIRRYRNYAVNPNASVKKQGGSSRPLAPTQPTFDLVGGAVEITNLEDAVRSTTTTPIKTAMSVISEGVFRGTSVMIIGVIQAGKRALLLRDDRLMLHNSMFSRSVRGPNLLGMIGYQCNGPNISMMITEHANLGNLRQFLMQRVKSGNRVSHEVSLNAFSSRFLSF